MLVIGYAVTTDVKHVRTAVYDLDNSQESRDLIGRFVGSGYFDVVEYVQNDDAARDAARPRPGAAGAASATTASPKTCAPAAPPRLQMLIDGTDSNTAGIVLQLRVRIATAYSDREILVTRSLGHDRSRPVRAGRSNLEVAGVVQREPGEPQLLRARRARDRRQP